MITKERLKELIEQNAIVYYVANNEICQFELTYKHNIYLTVEGYYICLYGNNGLQIYGDKLFESKAEAEDAEWHKEFGCIERTERFEPLYYNNIDQTYCYDYYFSAKNHHEYLIRVSGRDIILFWLDCNHKEYFKNTKEEYEKLIRRCAKMFLEGDYAN